MTNGLTLDTGVTALNTAAVLTSMGPDPVTLGGLDQLAMTP